MAVGQMPETAVHKMQAHLRNVIRNCLKCEQYIKTLNPALRTMWPLMEVCSHMQVFKNTTFVWCPGSAFEQN